MNNQVKTNSFLLALSKAKGRILQAVDKHPFISCFTAGFLMNVLIYMLHARSPIRGLVLIFSEPLFFLYNTLIILAFYCIPLFIPKRIFALSLVSVAWFAVSVTNCVLLTMRVTPLAAIDFYIVRTGIAIIHVYMSPFEIAASIVGIVAVVALLIFLLIKSPKSKPDFAKSLLVTACCLLLVVLLTVAFVGIGGVSPKNFEAEIDAYDTYGFPFCFLCSIFDRGIPEPHNYSDQQLQEILAAMAAEPSEEPERKPNVVMIQLESFFDPYRVEGVTISEDPIPNFHALAAEGSSGFVSVPSIGSGTANTEFEVLSGLNLDFFGAGEYPYTTILKNRCCETIAYNLAELGYATHAMHNHTGTFYDRYRVYANLGFDTFTPAEHMVGLEYTELNWEKDAILTEYIMKAMSSTSSSDFVFAVTVQGHGKYPEVPTEEATLIRVDGLETEELKNAYQYYVNQLYQVDLFIGQLKAEIDALEEDTVLVLYGDHLPSLELDGYQLTGTELQTDYVIWSNFPMETENIDMEAYQLSPALLNRLGIGKGLINKAHQQFRDSEEYQNILQLIGYDMLYGDQFAYGKKFPYETTDLKLGLDPIAITAVSLADSETYRILGQGFTPFSHVFVNGRKVDTLYVSDTELHVAADDIDAGDKLHITQISTDLQKMSQTDDYIILDKDIPSPD